MFIKSKIFAVFICLTSTCHASDLLTINKINQSVNIKYGNIKNSCYDDAKEKVKLLREAGVDANIIVVWEHGSSELHAIVHIQVDNKTYYLHNKSTTMATKWPETWDIIRIEN